jgi:hypothetical protein
MSEPTKEDYVVEFIKAFKAVEDEMEPFKEHRRDLKKNYQDNGWLTKQDISMAVKAYRMLKQGDDINQLTDYFDKINKTVPGV